MQEDFHYYGTYCAAILAGIPHTQALEVAHSAQFVDLCSRTYLKKIKAPAGAATTQLQLEMMDMELNPLGLQDITRIWAAFHFLPFDLYAQVKGGRRYRNKYRLICGPNGDLLVDTVKLAEGSGAVAAGLAMHVLADTWAHRCFAGTPSLVINNTNDYFFELIPGGGGLQEKKLTFRHNPSAPDDLERSLYTNTIYQATENSIMNLGHGRAGHLPDYSFIRYKYMPAWGEFGEIIKDNPWEYVCAFTQMIYALKCLLGEEGDFVRDRYAMEEIRPWRRRIWEILTRRQLDACEDWKVLGQELSGQEVEAFSLKKYEEEYAAASEEGKKDTFIGRFVLAALAQKSMVTNRIFSSGNTLAGVSVDYLEKGFKGIKDYMNLVDSRTGGDGND